jgi:hypothetical protein
MPDASEPSRNPDEAQEFDFSGSLKIAFGLVFGIPAAVVLILLVRYALRSDAKPSELGLGAVLIFCLTGLAIVLVPWSILGLRLKKIGPLEFEQVISTQKKEQGESIAFLQNQIDQLKVAVDTRSGAAERIEKEIRSARSTVPALVEQLLQRYPGRFFSPYTIKSWGGRQQGFEELGSFDKAEITQALLTMLAENKIRTRISKKGNTLYGVSRR